VIRWTDHIPPGQVLNGIASLEDIVPTVMAAVGVPDIKENLAEGHQAGDKSFHVHLDGYNQLPYLTGEVEESPRSEFFYYGEHELYALRYRNWKVHFQVKDNWFAGQARTPTVPQPVSLRVDPFEQRGTHPSTRCTPVRSSGPCCPPPTSSRCTQRRSNSFRPARHRPTSAPKTCSRRCSTRPPAA
jgi:arylsulfatase